jgi:glycosyltransferase involved in cell wall biosynthesis
MTISTGLEPSDALSLTVIIISYNEEINIPYAVQSVAGWARKVYVVDSFSTDRTCKIAALYGAEVVKHQFTSVGDQRNWALQNLPIDTGWIFFLDSDEYLPEGMKTEISYVLEHDDGDVNGFFTKIKFIYLGRWLKHGDLYRNLIRMIKKGRGRYIDTSGFHEKMVVNGSVGELKSYIVHQDRKSLADWVIKQMPRIRIDADMRFGLTPKDSEAKTVVGTDSLTIEGGRNRSLRTKLYMLPAPVRPFAQFFYRYIIKLGFLDGGQGFIYNFLLQFWYPMMVEVIYLELRYQHRNNSSNSKGL